MSSTNDGLVSGVTGCVNAIATMGEFLKSGLKEQAAYLHSNEALRAEMDAVFEQFEDCLIRPQSAPLLHAHVQTLAKAATLPEFCEAAAQVSAVIHAEQDAIALEIAPVVAQATQLTTFQHVRQLQSPGRVLIIGQDSQGKALQTEILTAPGKPLSIRSETLGFHDQTCDETLNRFQENLKEQGITITTTRRVRTLRQRLRSQLGVRQ
jgi:hypothetical protein